MQYENIESFNPKTCLFGKIARINRISNSIIRKHLSPFDITESQTSLLFVFSKKITATQKEPAEITKLEKSSVNRNIKRLIEQNFIEKKEGKLLEITNKGLKKVNAIIPAWEKAMEEINDKITFNGKMAVDILHKKLIN